MPEPANASFAEAWYEVIQVEELRQGDVLVAMPVFMQDPNAQLPSAEAISKGQQVTVPGNCALASWVILSPSCDLDTGRSKQVLLGQCLEANQSNMSSQGEKDHKQKLEVVRRGLDPSKFMLPAYEADPSLPCSIVSNRSLAMLPLDFVKRFVAGRRRLRLRHPFREKFGNWCGQWISNVGPENRSLIPSFAQVHAQHVLDANQE